MTRWRVEYSERAKRELRRLDKPVRQQIEKFVERLPDYPDPRAVGKALKGDYAGYWRYRVGDYRVICVIHDGILLVEVVKIDHRSRVYQKR